VHHLLLCIPFLIFLLFLLFNFKCFYFLVYGLTRFCTAEAKQGAPGSIVKGKKRVTNNEPIGLTPLSYHFVFRPAPRHCLSLRPPATGSRHSTTLSVSCSLYKTQRCGSKFLPDATVLYEATRRHVALNCFYFFFSVAYSFQISYPSAVPLLISLYFFVSCFTLHFHSFPSFFL